MQNRPEINAGTERTAVRRTVSTLLATAHHAPAASRRLIVDNDQQGPRTHERGAATVVSHREDPLHVPEQDTRVVELRVHGVLGASGPKLTDSVASVDVAGDGVGRVVRPADRLRRPVPGPDLRAGDRTVPRFVEGYIWGGMTSGGPGKATWALLFPFALANLAHWTLPPVRPESRLSSALGTTVQALLRVAALLLTMLFITQLTVVTVDLLAAQCLQPGSECASFVPDFLREFDRSRIWLGLLPVALAVLLTHRLSSASWHVTTGNSATARQGAPQPSARAPVLPGANVVSDPDTPALRALHFAAALSTVALLLLGGPFALSEDPRWIATVVLLGLCLLGCLLLDDPASMRSAEQRRMGAFFGALPRRALMGAAGLDLVVAAAAPPRTTGPLPGSGTTIDVITALLAITCVATAVALLPAARLARPLWTKLPSQLRPWMGGWFTAPIVFLAAMLGTGFGAGLALSVRQALGADQLELPAAYRDVATFWGASAALLGVTAAIALPVLLLWWWRRGRSGGFVPPEVGLLHAGRYRDRNTASSAWSWARLQQRYAHHVPLLVTAVLVASAALTALLRLAGLPDGVWADWLTGIGVVALAGLAIGLVRLVFVAAKERHAARYLGLLCDLTLFWPREAHPVVPPCYALKVIPELVARAQEHLADPKTRVVLVGHSQGSLLAAVATARLLTCLPAADRERVGLVTAGSQLQWAYSRAFPAVVPHDSLRDLAGSLEGRWRALCRGTDPMGGAVTTWSRHVYDGALLGVGLRPNGTSGPLPPATRGPTGALVLGGDHWLPDPQRGPVSHRRWVPGIVSHTDYTGDPEWDRAVSLAAGLDPAEHDAVLGTQEAVLGAVGAAGARGIDAARAVHRRASGVAPRGGDGASTDELTTQPPEAALAGTGGAVDAIPHGVDQCRACGNAKQVESHICPPGGQTDSGGAQHGVRPAGDAVGAVDEQTADSAATEAERLPVPDVDEPAGRAAPWERAQGLHPLE